MSSRASLNHYYRTVWNHALGCAVAVAESAPCGAGRGAGSARSVVLAHHPVARLATLSLAVALGWGLTQAIASQSFEAVQIQGLSFSSASAEMLMRVLSTATSPKLGFDAGLLPATFVGSLLGALVGGDFKFEGFKTENKLGHYMIGAVLMGFGAVLAGGCTVGAGMSGGSIFSLTAWLTLIAIWLGAGLAWRINRSMGWPI